MVQNVKITVFYCLHVFHCTFNLHLVCIQCLYRLCPQSFKLDAHILFLNFRCIPAVAVPCNWEELATCHKELNVCDPDALAGKNNVLTYLDDGNRLLYCAVMYHIFYM